METITKSTQKVTDKKSVKITGAEAIVKCLLEENVDLIYGYPGGAIMPVYDELYKYEKELQLQAGIVQRHQQSPEIHFQSAHRMPNM